MKTIPLLFFLTFILSCSNDDDASDDPTQQSEQMNEMQMEPARTLIPDAVFEAYLVEINADDTIDGSVLTGNLINVEQIVVDNRDISDLTGIEDCPNLFNLWLQNCNVSQLNLSNNLQLQFIYFDNNNLTSIDVSMLPLLEKLSGRSNNLSTIDVSNNPALELLEISNNTIEGITVALNPVLNRLDVLNNPLVCIEVNEDQLAATTLDWTVDNQDTLSLDCN